jgi:L-aspartate oxidase
MTTDILVIGGGIAGLTFAIKTATKRPDLKIIVLTKTVENESNTRYAQGGVAAVWDFEKDNFKKHIADTLDAGAGLCDKKAVEIVVKEGPERVREIIDGKSHFAFQRFDWLGNPTRLSCGSKNTCQHPN